MKSEIHLFIIWFNAVKKVDDIFADLQQRFEILGVYIVRWSEKHFSDNMSRFYGTNLPDGSFKEKHCGRGPFYLIVVKDPKPHYDLRKTSAAVERVNVNMFEAKQRYRQMTGGGHRIHATNTPQETDHDLMLLLQQDQQDFIEAHPSIWNGHPELIEADLPGADGWESMQQVFRVLNATIPYVVLRNFEGLPHQYTLEHHGDVDLLCNSMENMRFITNAQPVFNLDYRVLHQVIIGSQKVLFDFRFVDDQYYDTPWEKDILNRRRLSENGFFRPCKKDYFWTLLYHALVHKPAVSQDYIDRLCTMSKGIIDLIPDDFTNPPKTKSILDVFLTANGYQYTEPIDLSVYFNTASVGQVKLSLNRILATSKSMGIALGQLFTQAEDCSTGTPEFVDQAYRTEASLRRHFSPRRYALIKSIPLYGVQSVLEIGAESGILTRYVGERFEHVVALEGNPDLAQAAAARCRDLKSVSVQPLSPELLDTEEQFDLVIFNCDCASWIRRGATLATITTLLNKSIGKLTQNGVLLFTVDNPLVSSGIFSATPSLPADRNADEQALPGLHLNDLIDFFEKKEMENIRRFFLFPDHILPEVMFTDEAAERNLRSFGYWAATVCIGGGNSDNDLITAGEKSRAGNFDHMAGGIGILATRAKENLPLIPWQVMSFSSEARPDCTQTITQVKSGNDLIVQKEGRRLSNALFVFNPDMHQPLFEGYLADAALMSAVKAGNLDRVLQLLRQIGAFLQSSFPWAPSRDGLPPLTVAGDAELNGCALDALPRNLMLANGQMHAFDLEWAATIPLPLSYLLYRGLKCLQSLISPQKIVDHLNLGQFGTIDSFGKAIALLINQTQLFAPLANDHMTIFTQFDQRFFTFAFTGDLPDEHPSLMELYQRIKACYAEGDNGDLSKFVHTLNQVYEHRPETRRLLSHLSCSGLKTPSRQN